MPCCVCCVSAEVSECRLQFSPRTARKRGPTGNGSPPTTKKQINSSTEQKVKSSAKPQSPRTKRSNCDVKTQCATEAPKIQKKCPETKVRHQANANNGPYQKPELKKFPALPLKQSIASYLSSIEPFLSEEELKKEQKLTRKFVDNEGAELQELLEEEAERSDNWLTPRWTRSAYLTYQAPLTVFSNPGLSFPIQEFKGTDDFLNFTAKAIYGMCEFKQLVDENKIPVVKMGKHYLDNSQFGKIFGTVRRPGRLCDTIEQYSDADYIVVVYNNNYFKLPIYSESGALLHVHTLREALRDILECPIEVGEHFGLLTHDNRSNWAEAYTVLCRPHGNADTVETIEQSLFVVCLDNCVPVPKGKERVVQAHQLLHGGGVRQNSANRWMDKTIQLIVNPNGLAGFCYEHSPADCQPLAMLMDFVQQKVHEENYGCEGCESDKKVTSALLRFQPVNECINLWLCQARRNIHRIASQLQMNVIQFECHGKCFIKAQGLNPDSYIQMALSLAYYAMHHKLPAQYESAHLRIFHEGRTETIRSTSNESKSFLMAMHSEKALISDKLVALQKAVDAHEKLIKEAINGQGIDRHLFGLQEMALEQGMSLPAFFRSKGYVRSVTFQLFTSQVATSHEGFMAYGPLLSDGYGVCYNPQEKKITFAISAWKSCPEVNVIRFGKAIKKSLNDMRKLILNTGGDRMGEHPCKCEKVLL
ncbi:carnitine O-acetyltransferase-like [Drosophila erecta]|uniref:carnitine O-acetyltransferase-like n=1 Tax=Drosophila erecta TaxID=7220 RepID=UPI000F04FEE3|nr:carnitine O-acetyltransferase-like [Drosophila erecta]